MFISAFRNLWLLIVVFIHKCCGTREETHQRCFKWLAHCLPGSLLPFIPSSSTICLLCRGWDWEGTLSSKPAGSWSVLQRLQGQTPTADSLANPRSGPTNHRDFFLPRKKTSWGRAWERVCKIPPNWLYKSHCITHTLWIHKQGFFSGEHAWTEFWKPLCHPTLPWAAQLHVHHIFHMPGGGGGRQRAFGVMADSA